MPETTPALLSVVCERGHIFKAPSGQWACPECRRDLMPPQLEPVVETPPPPIRPVLIALAGIAALLAFTLAVLHYGPHP